MLYEKAQNADSVCQNVTVAASARAHVWYDVHTPPLHQGCAGQGVRRVWFGEGCASQPGADPGNLVQPHRVRRAPAVPHSRVRVPRAVRTQDARPDVPHLPVEGVHPHERVLAPVLLAQGIQVRQGHAVHAVHRRMPGESGAKINRGAHSSPRGSTDAVSVWPPRCRGGSTCDDRPGRFNRDAAARFGDRQRTRTHRTHTRVHPVATPRATRHHPRRTPPRWYRTRVRFLPRFFHHERKFLHRFWPFVFPRFRTSRLPLTPTPPFHPPPPPPTPPPPLPPPPPPLRVRLFGGRASTEGTTRTATPRKTRTRPSRSASCTRGWGGCTVGTGKARSEAGTTRSTCRTT